MNGQSILRIRSWALFALLVLVGCSKQEWQSLPPIMDDGCGECPNQAKMSLAYWAAIADSVLVGTVERVRVSNYPLLKRNRILVESTDECARVAPGLEITLGDVRTLSGAHRDEVVLTFGVEIARNMWGLLYEDAGNGEVRWLEGEIANGRRMGIDLWCDSQLGLCGNLGRPLLDVEPSGRVRFQEQERACRIPVPEGVDGLTIDELESALAAASIETLEPTVAEEIQEIRSLRLETPIWQRVSHHWGANCSPHPGESVPECESDDDCGPEDHCDDEGYCVD